MDTSSSSHSSSSSSFSSSSSSFGSDANPSFPYTPSTLPRRWRGRDRQTPRFFCESISGGGAAGGHHFLDACFLCKKPIAANDNIFMYRLDVNTYDVIIIIALRNQTATTAAKIKP